MDQTPRTPLPSSELTKRASVSQMLAKWGYDQHAPDDVVQMAALSNELITLRAGQAVVRLGYTDMNTVEIALKEKPPGTPILEYLSDRIEGIRPEIQRIIALQDGMPYYRTLPQPHPGLQDENIAKACAKLESTLIVTPSNEPCLVFLEHAQAKRYNSMGRQDQNTDPIRQYLGKTPILAVGARNVVAARINVEYTQTSALEQNYITPQSATTEIQRRLIQILEQAIHKKASNIAIQPDTNGMTRVRMRQHGFMVPMKNIPPMPPDIALEMANNLHGWSNASYTGGKDRVQGQLQGPAGGQFTFRTSENEVFVRASFTLPDSLGKQNIESISLRILPRNQLRIKLTDLHFTQDTLIALDDAVQEEQGLILFVGPTGSGKSTSIHGALDHHYELFGDQKNRLSLEDPVERMARGLVPHSISKDVGFDLMMQEILRQDPDVIFLGEMRDRSSTSIGIRAANTGHLVFSTIHSNNSLMAIGALRAYINNRFVDNTSAVMVSDFDLVNALSLIVAQKLVPHLCPNCSHASPEEYQLKSMSQITRYTQKQGILPTDPNDQKTFIAKIIRIIKSSKVANLTGCPECDHTGYIGELPITEVFSPNYVCKQLLIDMLATNRFQTEKLKAYRGRSLFEAAMERVENHETPLSALFV